MDHALDPRFTFDTLVVGSANGLAVGAARRVAGSPGSAYNPLFIQGGSGLGKTHLLTAIGHEAAGQGAGGVVYQTAERFVAEATHAVGTGDPGAVARLFPERGILLIDDAQLLGGRGPVQAEIVRAWDDHLGAGGQVVLASDRPPYEITGLDDRLLSRLAGGLLVDLAPPDHEMRVEIARRAASGRGTSLSPAVRQVLARVAFTNVRELQGAVTRLVAVQELEGRDVGAEEVGELLGATADARRAHHWMQSPEKVLWEWPYAQDWIEESLD